MNIMLNQRIVVKNPAEDYYRKEGIVVVVRTELYDIPNQYKETERKVLIGEMVSSWSPDKWLEIVSDNYKSA
jgi:hypothetical protein